MRLPVRLPAHLSVRLSPAHLSTLFENTLVPWKIEGIGGREVDNYVDLFSNDLKVPTLEEAEERALQIFNAIKGKKIQVSGTNIYSDESVSLPLTTKYTVIPYDFEGVFNPDQPDPDAAPERIARNSGWYDCNINCKVPKGSNLNIKSLWICAPMIRVTGNES